MGFLIDSPTLAADTRQLFDGPLEYAAYRPVLTPEGKMVWKEAFEDGHTEVHQQEPGAGWVKRIVLTVAGWLPIEWML